MSDTDGTSHPRKAIDARIEQDWRDVEARRADIGSREGGDNRRRAIIKNLERLGFYKEAS